MSVVVRRQDSATAAAGAALDVPGVARLSAGSGVEVSTLYPGGRTLGIRLTDVGAQVHIVADQFDLNAVADQVRTAVARVLAAAGQPSTVDVVVEDVEPAALNRRTAN